MSGLNRIKPNAIYGIGLSILALILLYLGIRPGVSRIDDHVGEATILFAADRPWIETANECVQVMWKVSGIREVHLNDNGVTGEGQAQQCSVLNKDINLTVKFMEGSTKTYRLNLDFDPQINTRSWFYFGVGLVSLIAGLGLLLPVPGVQLTTRIQKGASRLTGFFASEIGLNILLLLGIGFRVSQYLFDRAAWGDEAALMLNIMDRSYRQLWQPLDINQAAPIGFLLLEKLASNLFGIGEQAFRLVPLIVSILALFLFKYLSQRILDKKLVPLALLFFAGADRLLYYSVEVKQYSTDVCVALLIVVLYFQMQSKTSSLRRLLLWCLWGGLAIWFSHPAIFVLAAVALILLYDRLRSQSTIPYALIGVFCVWAASFIADYFISLRSISQTSFLNTFWDFAFAPLTIQTFPAWFVTRIMAAIQQAVFITPLIASAAFIFGLIVLFRVRKIHFLIIVMPIVIVLAAAIVRRYAFADRQILFTIPFFIWGVVVGIASLFKFLPKMSRVMAYALIILPIIATNPRIPANTPDERPIINYMKAHAQPDDIVYFFPGQDEVYKYYSRVFDLQVVRTIYGRVDLTSDGHYTFITYNGDYTFAPHERMWIYRGGTSSNTQTWDQTIAYFKQYATQIDQYIDPDGNRVVLFEYNDSPYPKQ